MDKQISNKIKQAMEEKGLTYRALENKTGISRSTLQRYIEKEDSKVSLDSIEKIAMALHIEPSYLIGWEDNPSPLSEKEKSLILSYRAHSEMQDAVNRLLGIEKQPEKKLSSTVSDIKPAQKTYIVRTVGRCECVKDVEMTAEEIEFYKNLPDVDETDL